MAQWEHGFYSPLRIQYIAKSKGNTCLDFIKNSSVLLAVGLLSRFFG